MHERFNGESYLQKDACGCMRGTSNASVDDAPKSGDLHGSVVRGCLLHSRSFSRKVVHALERWCLQTCFRFLTFHFVQREGL